MVLAAVLAVAVAVVVAAAAAAVKAAEEMKEVVTRIPTILWVIRSFPWQLGTHQEEAAAAVVVSGDLCRRRYIEYFFLNYIL